MRIQHVLELLVGLVFLATLPTGSAQRNLACTTNEDCNQGKCCTAGMNCSRRDMGSVRTGAKAGDVCECTSQSYDAENGRCGCTDDSHCRNNTCCTAEGICSRRDTASVLPGRTASDACECASREYSPEDEICLCNDQEPSCDNNRCCRADQRCSVRDQASVFGGDRAGDVCECASGDYNNDARKCLCKDDSHCERNRCCIDDGTCSRRAKGSLRAGRRPGDVCECASKIITPSTERCGCTDDSHCRVRRGEICLDNVCILQGKPVNYESCTVNDDCDVEGMEICSTTNTCVMRKSCTVNEDCDMEGMEICSATNTCETVKSCTVNEDCDVGRMEICSKMKVCAIGDPHMTGFYGQKFDFTGKDGAWYALISEPPSMQINMRVTVPVPSMPEITYITGFSLLTIDDDGLDHSIVVTAKEPHNLETACPVGVYPCLADGSLTVLLDGEEALGAPGVVALAPGIEVTAINIPGECRSFGFETYWARKKKDNAAYWASKEQENTQEKRKLRAMLSMGEWILAKPTATNMVDCTGYVARSAEVNGGLFAHQSEHSTFRIVTPATEIQLSHGKRHGHAKRDRTDTIDLPDHISWQMNIAIEHANVGQDAKGILGETVVPTRDAGGNIIMHGVECIRGVQEDYAVEGPLGKAFTMDDSTDLQDAAVGAFL